jgi:hypothetical protein
LVEELSFADAAQFSQAIELSPGRENVLALTVCDHFGQHVCGFTLSIRHDDGSAPAESTACRRLERPIQLGVLNRRGQKVQLTLAPAGAEIPGVFRCRCRTSDRSGRIVVPLLEGGRLLRTVSMAVADPPPVGTAVEVEMHVGEGRQAELRVRSERTLGAEVVSLDDSGASGSDAAAPLPDWRQFSQLVKHCLILAGKVADASGRDRGELFEQVYAQESYAEQAHRGNDPALYRECVENMLTFLRYLEGLRWHSVGERPGPDDLFHQDWMKGFAGAGDSTDGMLEAVL